jgi:hypothetical protein
MISGFILKRFSSDRDREISRSAVIKEKNGWWRPIGGLKIYSAFPALEVDI